jgi:hypothetical protein
MITPSRSGLHYRIVLQGECERLLAGMPYELVTESGRGWTSVVAFMRDESELYGLLDRFQDLALHIVSLNQLGDDVIRAPETGDTAGL